MFAADVSADGRTVVGRGREAGAAFRWTSAGGIAGLGEPAGVFISDAHSVSDDGSVVAGSLTFLRSPGAPPDQAFRWTSGDGLRPLGVVPGRTWSGGSGMSADGKVIVGNSGSDAFRWSEEGGFDVIANGWAEAASADGSVIAGTLLTSPDMREAYRWTESSGAVGIGSLVPGGNTFGRAISSDGSIIAGTSFANNQYEAFLWTEAAGMIGLGSIPGGESMAHAVSDDGSIVIGDTSSGALSPFMWTPGSGMRSLTDVLNNNYGIADQLTGWRLLNALGMSPDGRFMVGGGLHNGRLEAWLLDRGLNPPEIEPPPMIPIPEPSTFAMVGVILLFITVAKRHRLAARFRT